jgi:hypothetical protein
MKDFKNMFKKEVETNSGNKYLIGITEDKYFIHCYILQKTLFGFKELFYHEHWRTLFPDYDYATVCTICDYEQSIRDKKKLIKWSMS